MPIYIKQNRCQKKSHAPSGIRIFRRNPDFIEGSLTTKLRRQPQWSGLFSVREVWEQIPNNRC